MTKNSPVRASGAHVSIVAHTTREELMTSLTEVDRANGFAKRFIYLMVRRAKCLPESLEIPADVLVPLVDELGKVANHARDAAILRRDEKARALWAKVYPRLSEGESGLLGAVLARAEAHVLRLSILYAVLDRAREIREEHLRAALAVWDYADASTRRIFGAVLGLTVADTILAALRKKGAMTKTEIIVLFGRNKSVAEIDAVLVVLQEHGWVKKTTRAPEGGKGRPAEVWEIADPTKQTK